MDLSALCLGPLTVGVISYDTDLTLKTHGELGAYQVNIPSPGSSPRRAAESR